MINLVRLMPTKHSYYNLIGYIPFAALYIPMSVFITGNLYFFYASPVIFLMPKPM